MTCPGDLLPSKVIRLHLAGFFRALGSALDCLASCIVGVLGLPQDILRADFERVKRFLLEESQRRGVPLWVSFTRVLREGVGAAGPIDWDLWLNDYRNMLVHRARRIEFGSFQPHWSVVDARGRPVPNANPITQVVRDPGLSNVEAMARQIDGPSSFLTEDARETVQEVFRSVHHVLESAAAGLAETWNQRRNSPDLIRQPNSQWPRLPNPSARNFPGYRPGTVRADHDAAFVSESAARKFKCAALADGPNHVWRGLFPKPA
jgi:hypothetical protein